MNNVVPLDGGRGAGGGSSGGGSNGGGSGGRMEGAAAVDERDVKRLEERIDASEERSTLRLEAAIAKLDGKFELVGSKLDALHSQGRENRNTVIAAAIAIVIGIAGVMLAMKQIWIGGVQVGQQIASTTTTEKMPTKP